MYGDDIEIEALERTKLASARRWILGIGVWWLLHALIAHIIFDEVAQSDLARTALYVGLSLCVVHTGLFFWSRRSALAATSVALAGFLILHAIIVAAEWRILITGSVHFVAVQTAVRILFVVKLADGVSAAFAIRRLRAQQPKLPVARVIP